MYHRLFTQPNAKSTSLGLGICLLIVLSLSLYFILPGQAQEIVDKIEYDKELEANANYPADTPETKKRIWPAKAAYPYEGALLPYNRIVAYYGNFFSKRMGVLGEYPPEQMLKMLNQEVTKWRAADPNTPVIPAIEYIAVVAQRDPGADRMYRYRMPDSEINKAINLANQINGIAILDIQAGFSSVQAEIKYLEKYLMQPNVMLALDPEFFMKKSGKAPGKVIGTLDAADINYAVDYLAKIVKENNLPPKILIIHRFTQRMVTNYKAIKTVPEVQIVMDMDGWGSKPKKYSTYHYFIASEPVQFTGFKMFYKNDLKAPSTGLYTPEEILKFTPQPVFIMYQ